MKAAIVSQYGSLDQVAINEVPVPTCGPDEVLVQLTAASLNPLDVKLISGNMQGYFPLALPFIVGTDLSGIVAEVGSSSTQWKKGERVLGRLEPLPVTGSKYGKTGALAEYAILPATALARIPNGLDLTKAAALPTAACTAWQALIEMAQLQPSQTVLIHGGAGGVGGFAIQIAKHAGAHVISTASKQQLDFVRASGADQVIDYQDQDFSKIVSNVDVVLDLIGGETQEKSFGVLRRGGHLLTTAHPPDEEKAKAHDVRATFVFHTTDAARLARIIDLYVGGTLKIEIGGSYSLSQAKEALMQLTSGHTRGKLLVTPA